MSLINLFNFKFLKENMKRSKAIMFLCVFLMPIINVISFLMRFVNSGYATPNIFELSILSIVGLYIVPVILSITLFSFVYKRKSSDFVMSFPVTRKQIFLTNTLGGIILIIVMNLVNAIFALIASLLLSNVFIDYKMIFDMFLLWSISYIFVFVCTNIAVCLSSNKITTVVVTLLILFLIPFVHTFISYDAYRDDTNSIIATQCDNEMCEPAKYECGGTTCEVNRKKGIYMYTGYTEVNNTNYTIPYSLVAGFLFNIDGNYKINNTLLKMVFLSIIYIFIGVILFGRRKFEVVETSFKSDKVHLLVRSLTTVPILCIYYILLINSSISISDLFTILFLFALLMTYIIIYDLLTRKRVMNIFKTLASLIVVGIFVIFIGELTKNDETILDVNDIDTMTFTDYDNGYTYDRKIISYVISKHIDDTYVENMYDNLDIMIDVGKKSYKFQISVTEEEYNYIKDLLNKDKTYLKTINKVNGNDFFAISIGNDITFVKKNSNLYNKLLESYEKKYSNFNEFTDNDYLFNVDFYSYDNYEVKKSHFNIYDDKELMNEIILYYNSEVKEVFENPEIEIDYYYIGNGDSEEYYSSYNYEYENIDKFIIDNIDEKVDICNPYMYIKFNTYDISFNRSSYVFFTNKISELKNIISEYGKLYDDSKDMVMSDEKSTY